MRAAKLFKILNKMMISQVCTFSEICKVLLLNKAKVKETVCY